MAQELQEQAGQTAVRDAPSAELVSAVQVSLGALGYGGGAADGILGPDTVAAVRQFQAAQGLPETGVVTQQLAFLLSLLVERATAPAVPDLVLVGSGTGFLVTDRGEILTNNHVVEACTEVRVRYDGEAYVADHVSSDVQADLALLDGDFGSDDFVAFRGGGGFVRARTSLRWGFPCKDSCPIR